MKFRFLILCSHHNGFTNICSLLYKEKSIQSRHTHSQPLNSIEIHCSLLFIPFKWAEKISAVNEQRRRRRRRRRCRRNRIDIVPVATLIYIQCLPELWGGRINWISNEKNLYYHRIALTRTTCSLYWDYSHCSLCAIFSLLLLLLFTSFILLFVCGSDE